MNKHVDYTIVGAGLAGLMLGYLLHKKGQKVLIYNNNQPASSSVAAGTWNPITFKKFIPSYRAEEMIAAMKEVYPQIEEDLGAKLFAFMPIEKVIANQQELEFWEQRKNNPESGGFLGNTYSIKIGQEDHFAGEIYNGGRLDLPLFVELLRKYFLAKNILINSDFEYHKTEIKETFISYKDITSDKLIFCEGSYYKDNPFLNWIPMKPVKGDVLTVENKTLNLTKIRKKNVFLLPLKNGRYKLGATYDHSQDNWLPDNNAKLTLLEKFKMIGSGENIVIDHKSGIRPASFDRRVIMGRLPQSSLLYCFNGLGSKGVFLAPLMAKELIDYIETGKPLDAEVDIQRCVKKYFPKEN